MRSPVDGVKGTILFNVIEVALAAIVGILALMYGQMMYGVIVIIAAVAIFLVSLLLTSSEKINPKFEANIKLGLLGAIVLLTCMMSIIISEEIFADNHRLDYNNFTLYSMLISIAMVAVVLLAILLKVGPMAKRFSDGSEEGYIEPVPVAAAPVAAEAPRERIAGGKKEKKPKASSRKSRIPSNFDNFEQGINCLVSEIRRIENMDEGGDRI